LFLRWGKLLNMAEQVYNIKIIRIDIVDKAILRTPIEIKETDEFRFDLKTQSVRIGTEKDTLGTFVSVSVSLLDKPEVKLGLLTIVVVFQINDFDITFQPNEKNEYIIPNELENVLKSVSVSTTRGVLYSEFRGTPLHRAVLPIIMLDSFKPSQDKLLDVLDPNKGKK
jgi:hypothetical protein